MSMSMDQLEERMHAVDRYVQGEMSPSESAAFEARMHADESLAADVAAQRDLTGSLSRAFAPSAPPVIADLPRDMPPSGGIGRLAPPVLWGGGAALIAAAAAITWFAVPSTRPSSPPSDAAALYQQTFAGQDALPPRTTDDVEIAIMSKIGRSVLFDEQAGDEKPAMGPIGGGIAGSSPLAVSVPAMLGNDRVLIVVDLARADEKSEQMTTVALSPTLFKHSIVRGGLRLVEVSPRPRPTILPRMRVGK